MLTLKKNSIALNLNHIAKQQHLAQNDLSKRCNIQKLMCGKDQKIF